MNWTVSSVYLETFVLVVTRVGAIFFLAPMFGYRTIPARVKIGLAATVTLVLVPLEVEDARALGAGLPFFLAVASEALLGLAIGYVLSLVMAGLEAASAIVGVQMGFGLAEFFDPISGGQSDTLQQFYAMLAALIFLGINGHHLVLQGMADSFRMVPLGTFDPAVVSMDQFALLVGGAVSLALRVAMPVLATMVIADVGLVFMARALPQANMLVVGFPIKVLAGLLILMVSLPFTLDVMSRAFTAVPGQLDFLFPSPATARG